MSENPFDGIFSEDEWDKMPKLPEESKLPQVDESTMIFSVPGEDYRLAALSMAVSLHSRNAMGVTDAVRDAVIRTARQFNAWLEEEEE